MSLPVAGAGLQRVSYILDIVRGMANIHERAEIISENNFGAKSTSPSRDKLK